VITDTVLGATNVETVTVDGGRLHDVAGVIDEIGICNAVLTVTVTEEGKYYVTGIAVCNETHDQ